MEAQFPDVGADHPDSIDAAANLATTYWDQGQRDMAERMYEQVVERSVRVIGREHPDTQRYVNNLITVYTKLGKLERAQETRKLLV